MKALFKGEIPAFLPENKVVSQREFQSLQYHSNKKNPIQEAYKFLEYLETYPNSTYQDLADEFNISKARVCQMIALVKKLPKEIIDYLSNINDSKSISYFTERKLRPLTMMDSDMAKIEKFKEIKGESILK